MYNRFNLIPVMDNQSCNGPALDSYHIFDASLPSNIENLQKSDLSLDAALGLPLVGTESIGSRIFNSSPSRRTTTDLLEPIVVLGYDD